MNTPLDGPTPLYIQIADILEARITDGTYPVNTPVPSVRGIREKFDVSARTAEAALAELKERGLVVSAVGKGTYVLPIERRPSGGRTQENGPGGR
jgi:GntR family transcriptional regulator